MWGVQDLVIRYGTHMAVRGVSLSVAPGSVLALVGGDGAGKTSILRAIVGALQPVSGRVSRPPKEQIGYVSAGPGLYRDLTVEENLRFAGRAYGMTPQAVEEGSRRLLEAMALSAARGRVAGKLSGGMRQKLGLAMALLHGPQLLVLDEPTTGVDPVSRAELWRQIARAAAAGAAVVIATSYIDRAEEVLVLSEGTPLLNGPPEAVVASLPGLLFTCPGRPGGVQSWRRGRAWRAWSADAVTIPGAQPVQGDLEDAVVVAELARATAGTPRQRVRS